MRASNCNARRGSSTNAILALFVMFVLALIVGCQPGSASNVDGYGAASPKLVDSADELERCEAAVTLLCTDPDKHGKQATAILVAYLRNPANVKERLNELYDWRRRMTPEATAHLAEAILRDPSVPDDDAYDLLTQAMDMVVESEPHSVIAADELANALHVEQIGLRASILLQSMGPSAAVAVPSLLKAVRDDESWGAALALLAVAPGKHDDEAANVLAQQLADPVEQVDLWNHLRDMPPHDAICRAMASEYLPLPELDKLHDEPSRLIACVCACCKLWEHNDLKANQLLPLLEICLDDDLFPESPPPPGYSDHSPPTYAMGVAYTLGANSAPLLGKLHEIEAKRRQAGDERSAEFAAHVVRRIRDGS